MVKYSLGLDIGAKTIHACISTIDAVQKVKVISSMKLANSMAGFKQLEQWISKHYRQKELPFVVLMEATGVYYEHCALYLHKLGYAVTVILPNKAKKWLQADGFKSKNDKIDAQGLSKMGAEKSFVPWQPCAEFYYQLRILTRHYQSLQEQKTVTGNQLHADLAGMYRNEEVLQLLEQMNAVLCQQLEAVAAAVKKHIASDEQIAARIAGLCTIKGIGLLTAAVIIAETNGFALFENVPQLVSYAGYDVVENQSGNRTGKTKISKKGNSRIRRALHMPALNVVRYKIKPFIDLFERTYIKHSIKMKSYVAVQKKLLVTIYGLWKRNTSFNEPYVPKHTQEKEQVPPPGSAIAEIKYAAQTENKSSLNHRPRLHKVSIPSEISQYASSRQ